MCRFPRRGADKAAKELGARSRVVKAQIHAGGRGKGRFKEPTPVTRAASGSRNRATRPAFAEQMLGKTLVTMQTGPRAARSSGSRSRRAPTSPASSTLGSGRPRHLPRRDHRLDRRRHGHRGGGAQDAGEDLHASTIDPATRLHAVPRPQGRLRTRAYRASQVKPCAKPARHSTSAFVEQGHEPARDQPARRHRRRRARRASTPRSTSTTTPCSATRHRRAARLDRGRPRRVGRRKTTSAT